MNEFIRKNSSNIIILSLIALIILAVAHKLFLPEWELKTYDLRTNFRLKPADPNIVIIQIDNATLQELSSKYGRWPWPRTAYSKVIKEISDAGAKSIFVDIKFEDPAIAFDDVPKFSDQTFANDIKDVKNVIFAQEISRPYSEFVKSMKKFYENSNTDGRGNVIPFSRFLEEKYKGAITKELILWLKMSAYNDFIINKISTANKEFNDLNYTYMKPYIETVYRMGYGIGIVNIVIDEDSTARRVKPVYKYGNYYLLHAALATVYRAMGDTKPIIIEDNTLTIGKRKIALDESMNFYINWRTAAPEKDIKLYLSQKYPHPYIPFLAFYKNPNELKNIKDFLKDKIVIIGTTADKAGDFINIPEYNSYPGPEVLATIMDNIINDNDFIVKVPEYVNIFVSLSLVIIIFLIFRFFPLSKSYLLALMYAFSILVLYTGINIFMFTKFSYWLDLTGPIFDGSIALIFAVIYSLLIEKEKRSSVENTFSKYVSPQIYKTLLTDYEKVNLGANKKEITILFSDIRGFTPFTEDLSPEEVADYLNEYFTEMVKVILKNNGTVDKFMGDAVMAFFGAPVEDEKHPEQAINAAIEMLEALNVLNQKWLERGRRELNIGIGINTGLVLVGNFGSPELMDYTTIGDPVNLAARLETLNKEEGTNIIISENTYNRVKDLVNVREIGERRVKGKSESVMVYELISLRNLAEEKVVGQYR